MTVRVEPRDGWLELVLDRPGVANALDREHVHRVRRVVTAASRKELRFVLLRGQGSAFCAGADLREFPWLFESPRRSIGRIWQYQMVSYVVHASRVPIVTYSNGSTVGGGCGLFWASSRSLAGHDFRLRLGFRRLGLGPDMGVSLFLQRRVGRARAHEIVRNDDWIGFDEARALGLIDNVSGPLTLDEAVLDARSKTASRDRATIADRLRLLVALAREAAQQSIRRPAHDVPAASDE